MQKTLEEIKAPIYNQMLEFNECLLESTSSNVKLLTIINNYILENTGKQIRPLFIILIANLISNGQIKKKTFRAAIAIELLHNATLVHDDVVDESNLRRGIYSVNVLWGNKVAVKTGDFLLSKLLLLLIDNGDTDILKIISIAIDDMSKGELLQIEMAKRLNITEDVYFEIIRKKTATLMAASCSSGACSIGADNWEIKRFKKMGEYIGIAFQIKDDIMDYGKYNIGKPVGNDLKERKITLPLIHVLSNANQKSKARLIKNLKNIKKDPNNIDLIMDYVSKHKGIEYAEKKMRDYIFKATDIVSTYPQSEYKESIISLIDFVVNRKS